MQKALLVCYVSSEISIRYLSKLLILIASLINDEKNLYWGSQQK